MKNSDEKNDPSTALLSNLENMLRQKGYGVICGVDEAGRGPLAGPVVAAAVIIPTGEIIVGLDDSKRLSSARREQIFDEIIQRGYPCAVRITASL